MFAVRAFKPMKRLILLPEFRIGPGDLDPHGMLFGGDQLSIQPSFSEELHRSLITKPLEIAGKHLCSGSIAADGKGRLQFLDSLLFHTLLLIRPPEHVVAIRSGIDLQGSLTLLNGEIKLIRAKGIFRE